SLLIVWIPAGANPVGRTVSFVHHATASNITGNYTQISIPDLEGNSGLILFATPRRNGPGTPSVTVPIGVWFSGGHWYVLTEDRSPIPADAEFNIVGIPVDRHAFVHTANGSNSQSN